MHPEGFHGQKWNIDRLSQNETNNSKDIFLSFPFAQKQFKEELIMKINYRKYGPGSPLYFQALEEFNERLNNINIITD